MVRPVVNQIKTAAATKLQSAIKRSKHNAGYIDSLSSIISHENKTKLRINAAKKLQAAVKQSDVQPIYNEAVEKMRENQKNTSAITLQGAVRNRIAKREIMKQRQTVKKE